MHMSVGVSGVSVCSAKVTQCKPQGGWGKPLTSKKLAQDMCTQHTHTHTHTHTRTPYLEVQEVDRDTIGLDAVWSPDCIQAYSVLEAS